MLQHFDTAKTGDIDVNNQQFRFESFYGLHHLLTAVQLLDIVRRSGRPLADLADAAMTRLPQVLHNVRVASKGMDVTAALAEDIAAVEAELGDHGRVLIRGSGTEPLVRVMVEAPTHEQAEAAAGRLVTVVEGLGPP